MSSPKLVTLSFFHTFTSQMYGKRPVFEFARMPVNSAFQHKVTYIAFVLPPLRRSKTPLISRLEAAIQTFVYGFAKTYLIRSGNPHCEVRGAKHGLRTSKCPASRRGVTPGKPRRDMF